MIKCVGSVQHSCQRKVNPSVKFSIIITNNLSLFGVDFLSEKNSNTQQIPFVKIKKQKGQCIKDYSHAIQSTL